MLKKYGLCSAMQKMLAKFPEKDPHYYGTVQPMCWYMHLTGLTEERIKTLKEWLSRTIAGDVCAGSVKEN